MVDISLVYKSNSEHLKAEDIGDAMPTYTIAGQEERDFGNGDRKVVVSFSETDKTLPLNSTNAHSIASLYGTETSGWIGQSVMLFTMPVDFQGRTVLGIRVRAPQAPAMPPQGNQAPPPSSPNDYGANADPRRG